MSAEGTAATLGLKQSASLGSLIDAGASLSNRREALTVSCSAINALGAQQTAFLLLQICCHEGI